jgi:hypothetical protein
MATTAREPAGNRLNLSLIALPCKKVKGRARRSAARGLKYRLEGRNLALY